jgi:hypothetical protein
VCSRVPQRGTRDKRWVKIFKESVNQQCDRKKREIKLRYTPAP